VIMAKVATETWEAIVLSAIASFAEVVANNALVLQALLLVNARAVASKTSSNTGVGLVAGALIVSVDYCGGRVSSIAAQFVGEWLSSRTGLSPMMFTAAGIVAVCAVRSLF